MGVNGQIFVFYCFVPKFLTFRPLTNWDGDSISNEQTKKFRITYDWPFAPIYPQNGGTWENFISFIA